METLSDRVLIAREILEDLGDILLTTMSKDLSPMYPSAMEDFCTRLRLANDLLHDAIDSKEI